MRVRTSALSAVFSMEFLEWTCWCCWTNRLTNHRDTSAEIDDAAAGWAARLDGETLTPDETLTLETWLAGDPRRRGALARAMAILAHRACGPRF